MQELIAKLKTGDRVIITALGTENYAREVMRAGAYPVFCDVDATGTDADIAHLKELAASPAAGFICTCDGAGARLARDLGITAVVCAAGEYSKPAYRDRAFRFAPAPPEQYPYYMLVLSNAEDICRRKVRTF